ncbi:MAG TPA: PLP-dependent aminotransferase family protein [Firmicutes bacterium]|jgi:2-aminoadipate transaminase|nr:PLP-dependent aminotransferase family protein [Bacillota bacterium]
MSLFSVERGPVPIYLQVKNGLEEIIRSGALPPGTKLPSSRTLARILGVSRNSVLEAYQLLTTEGIVEAYGTVGTYVSESCCPKLDANSTETSPLTGENLHLLKRGRQVGLEEDLSDWVSMLPDIAGGFGPCTHDQDTMVLSGATLAFDRLSAERLRSCLNYVLTNYPHKLLAYGDTEGYRPLRQWLAEYMTDRGVVTSADEVLLTGGFQQGLTLLCSTFLNPGDVVLTENPGYPGVLMCLLHGGAKVRGIDMTPSGVDVGQVEEMISRFHPRFLCVMPFCQNPTGITMDTQTRKYLLKLANDEEVMIIENGFTDELSYSGRLVPPLKAEDRRGCVVYMGSLSDILFPGLRIGWITASRPIIKALALSKRAIDPFSSPVLQAACYEFCRQGYFATHLARIRKLYSRKRELVSQALQKYLPSGAVFRVSEGRMSVWLVLPEGVDSTELHREARALGASFVPGFAFFFNGGGERNLLISYAGSSEQGIMQEIKTIGDLISRRLSSRG